MDEPSAVVLMEADTCREYVTPAIKRAGWGGDPHAIGEQHVITAGGILLVGGKARRAKQRRADYLWARLTGEVKLDSTAQDTWAESNVALVPAALERMFSRIVANG